MIIPIGDTPNPLARPYVTWALIALNVLVYLAFLPASLTAADPRDPAFRAYLETLVTEGRLPPSEVRAFAASVSAYDLVVFEHGFLPAEPALLDILTSMFLHGGLMHLAGNMLFLWIYGDNVEHRLGRLGYLAAYLGTGLLATLTDGLLRAGSSVPSVGASGAISGLLGAYFIWFPRNRVRLWVFLFPFFANVIEVSARLVLGFYLVIDNLLPLFISGGAGGVAYGAHIGGFFAGLALALVLRGTPRREPRAPRAAPASHREDPATPLSIRFPQAIAAGDLEHATALLFGEPRAHTREGLRVEDKLALGRALLQSGRAPLALQVFQRVLAENPVGPWRAKAHLGAAEVLLRQQGMETAAFQHLYDVLEEPAFPDDHVRARTLLEALRQRTRSLPRF